MKNKCIYTNKKCKWYSEKYFRCNWYNRFIEEMEENKQECRCDDK